MRLHQIRLKFEAGNLEKQQYILQAHGIHQVLFEYAEYLKMTDIEKIEILDDRVIMTIRESGIKIICDKYDQRIIPVEILNFGQFEKADNQMLLSLIEEGNTVLDIGANIGWYSMNIAKRFQHVNIHAFEPIPKTFQYLKSNLELNEVVNVYLHNFGFSNENKELTFYYYPECSGNASSVNLSESTSVETITCHVTKLDKFTAENDLHIDLIKCDVEGAELFVFEGGYTTLKEQQPIVYTEMLRKWAAKFNYHPNAIIDLMKEAGYRCFTADGSGLKEFFTMDENTTETNFFFLHKEKHQNKINQLVVK